MDVGRPAPEGKKTPAGKQHRIDLLSAPDFSWRCGSERIGGSWSMWALRVRLLDVAQGAQPAAVGASEPAVSAVFGNRVLVPAALRE